MLRRGIQSQAGNFTRFFEVAATAAPVPAGARCKTSLLLALAHQPGALGRALAALGDRGINLTKLESRPLPGTPWQYRFYLDLEGHAASEAIVEALEALRPLTTELRVLGTYPRAAPVAAADETPAAGMDGEETTPSKA